uniref:Uncharacterized protein n=1 Tax=Glossina pallidipes TaxID=7398 RepID=A0A1A9Z286_GLOPL
MKNLTMKKGTCSVWITLRAYEKKNKEKKSKLNKWHARHNVNEIINLEDISRPNMFCILRLQRWHLFPFKCTPIEIRNALKAKRRYATYATTMLHFVSAISTCSGMLFSLETASQCLLVLLTAAAEHSEKPIEV